MTSAIGAARYAALLRSGRWFAGLPEDMQEALLGAAVVRQLSAGERLFSRGDPPDGLLAVVDGSVRIGALTDQGAGVLLAVIEAPGWFGEVSAFDRGPRSHDATAQVESVVVRVPQAALEALLAERPHYWRHLGALLVSKVRVLFGAVEDKVARPLSAQLAQHLLLVAGALGERDHRRVVVVGQAQLATMLGASRQTVNQLLKDFEARGLVRVSYRRIELVDVERLRAIATSSQER